MGISIQVKASDFITGLGHNLRNARSHGSQPDDRNLLYIRSLSFQLAAPVRPRNPLASFGVAGSLPSSLAIRTALATS